LLAAQSDPRNVCSWRKPVVTRMSAFGPELTLGRGCATASRLLQQPVDVIQLFLGTAVLAGALAQFEQDVARPLQRRGSGLAAPRP